MGKCMGSKKLLIVGVDPGTTLGYAALDIDGNLVSIGSGKNIDRSILISRLVALGKVLVVAGDKEKNQELIELVGIKLGAKIITPEYDMKVEEKRDMARAYPTGSQHEIDSLASALMALKKLKPLIQKIEVFLSYGHKEHLRDELLGLVVGKGLNIRDAADLLEPEEEIAEPVKKPGESKPVPPELQHVNDRLRRAKKEMGFLREHNLHLQEDIALIRKEKEGALSKFQQREFGKEFARRLFQKESKVQYLEGELRKRCQEIHSLRDHVSLLFYFLSRVNGCLLLKKLDNLGTQELFRKEKILNIEAGDILLVKDPDIFGENAVEALRKKVTVIVSKKPVSRKVSQQLPFFFLPAAKLKIEESRDFAIVQKTEFNALKQQQDVLGKVLEEYRRERDAGRPIEIGNEPVYGQED